jgi:hypothetical protein
MASIAGLKKSFVAEINKVENREDFAKRRVKLWWNFLAGLSSLISG